MSPLYVTFTRFLLAAALLAAAAPEPAHAAMQVAMQEENKFITDLRAKADKGDADAQFKLGNSYFVGVGITKNYSESVRWLRKSAEQGNPKAESMLGTLYFQGLGIGKDVTEAAKWWHKAADQHDRDAQTQLGFAYLLGDGAPRNFIYAYMWFNLAAAAGDQHAAKDRDSVAKYMSSDQIADAQRLQKEWSQKHP